ncbi:carbohydrate-binding protein [Streptomyces sp. NBC_01020]|uniref:CBM35 domain-containing protein n=1 Tax=Streptomyces sp. NBC_01020 TaxID=2903722 RepID=UPI00386B1534|nr:carbohydrate-binding protein [Streptomyces sp. NBC_01020]
MTAGNNGTSTPEDDDPFGYLYEDGRAAGAVPPPGGGGYGYPGPTSGGQPGVPRTSYNHVRTVGERQYGQQAPQQQYGQQPQYAQQQAYGQPTAQYAAPETYPGGPPVQQPPRQPGNGGNGGPNHKGLLIGAVAVVAVVVIGIGVALATSGGDSSKDKNAGSDNAGGGQTSAETTRPSHAASTPPKADLPKQDAATLQLGGGAITDKSVDGAQGPGGSYINGFNAVGSSVTWQANVENAGDYKLYVRYAIPAKDANATLTVNGKANNSPLGLKNFIHGNNPDWAKNWQTTWAPVTLKQGQNTIKLSCETGNQCNAILDWLQIKTP